MPTLPLEHLRAAALAEPLGIYLHVPFCVDRCTYCSFVSTCDRSLKPRVITKLAEDLAEWGESLDRPGFDTLYLGGGTPSVLDLDELALLTTTVMDSFDRKACREATLEVNPGTVDAAWMTGARHLGWDRISLGIQTLDDRLLAWLGRIHDGAEGLSALGRARAAGFERISADLMIGIPGQDPGRIREDAERLVEAGASHLSIYMLDLDKACPLKAQVDAGLVALPPEEEVAAAFEVLQAELPRLGFTAYEISNYARPGEESLHNTRYWERRPYLGVGPGAASHLGSWRWSEDPDIEAWALGRGDREIQELDTLEALAEIPLLGLRMRKGIDWDRLRRKAQEQGQLSFVDTWEKALASFITHGLLEREGPVLRLTQRGVLLSNRVLEIFI